jgi:hypothetical protein
MPVRADIVLPKGAALIEEEESDVVLPPGATLISDKKKASGAVSATGTIETSPSTSPVPLTSEEVAKGVFSFGQLQNKKAPLPANIPRTQKTIESALKNVHFGAIGQKQLTDLFNDANGKEVAKGIIKQYAPDATDENIDNPAIIEAAAKNIKQQNRINFVEAEKGGIVEMDEVFTSNVADFNKGIPNNSAGTMTGYINELRRDISIDDLNNNDKISDVIARIKKVSDLEQGYLSGEEKKQAAEKTQGLLNTLNNRLLYNISRTGVSPTLNQLDDQIQQAVISKVMEGERGEVGEASDKDQIKLNQFKLGLTAIEKSDPVLFKNVVNSISSLKKVPDSDFSVISKIGQQIDNQVRFRGAAYDPNLIDTETEFEYDTFGQKKSAAAGAIGEWMKEKGYKNMNQFPEKLIRQAAKETGIDNPEIVNSLIFDEKLGGYDAIPKSGWVDDVTRGIMQPLEGINSTLSSWSESPAQTYLRSKDLSGTFGSQKVPDKKGVYSDILESEHSFTTDMFRGLGQFIPQILLTKGVGGAVKAGAGLAGAELSAAQAKNVADYGGTFISTFLQSYGPAYEEHLQKTGDASTSALVGTIDGISSAAFELILPDVKIAGKAFDGLKQGFANDLVGLVRKGGDPAELLTKARPMVAKFFKSATNTMVQENLEELGTQYADFVTESIFDPKSAKDRNINKELWDTFKSTTAAMLLPSVLGAGGGSFTKDFTTKSLHSAAINLDSYKESLQNSLDKEYISQDDFNKSVKILQTHQQSIGNAPEINANGQTLAPEKKLDYALEDTKIKVYKEKAAATEGVAKEMWEGKIKQAEDVQREILMPKETPVEETAVTEEVVVPETNAAPVAEEVTTTLNTDEQLFDKVYEKGLDINNILVPENKTESVSILKDQALSTPSNINDKLGGDIELTTDLIAASGVEKINTQIQSLTDQQKNPETTDQETEEIDKHLSLLDKGLEKATILESKTNTNVSQETQTPAQADEAKATGVLNQEDAAVETNQAAPIKVDENTDFFKIGKLYDDKGVEYLVRNPKDKSGSYVLQKLDKNKQNLNVPQEEIISRINSGELFLQNPKESGVLNQDGDAETAGIEAVPIQEGSVPKAGRASYEDISKVFNITEKDPKNEFWKPSEKSATEVMDWLGKSEFSLPHEKELISEYKKVVDPKLKIIFDTTMPMNRGGAAVFNKGKLESIQINPKATTLKGSTSDFTQVVLHEITHALTYDKSGNMSKELVDNLAPLYDIANDYINDNIESLKGKFNEHKITYGLSGINEFAAEAMANRDFQNILSSIPYKNTKQTVWQKVVEGVKNYFSKLLGTNNESLLNEIVKTISQDISKNNENPTTTENNASTESKTKPKVRVSAEQVKDAQPKTETAKVDRKGLSDQLRTLLGNNPAALSGDINPNNRLSFKDIGLKKGDTIQQAIEKAIAHGEDFSELLKIIQGDPNLKNVTIELVDRLPNGEMGLYHPVGHGEGKDGLLQIADQANVKYSLVHELSHFLTLDSKAAEDVKDSAGYKGIEELYNYVAAKKGKPVAGSATLENYGLTNVKEFMAEMFINPAFRKYVSDIFETNKGDILKTNKFLRDSKVSSIGDMIANFFRDLFNKLLGKGQEGVEIDASKSVIDNAVKLATDLFLGGQDVTGGQTSSEGAVIPLATRTDSKAAALGLPGADQSKIINDFVKSSFINRATEEDIIGSLVDNGFTEGYAKSVVEENRLSGIKKALVPKNVVEGVDLDRVGDKEMMSLGKKLLDSGEVKAESIINRIVREGSGVLEPKEVVALIRYKADIDNSLRDAYKEKNRLAERGEDLGTATQEINSLEEKKDAYEIMSVITAQQQSMAFRLRKMLLDREYNVTTQIERYKANNNGFISPEVEAKFREMDRELIEVKAQLSEAEQRAQDDEANESIQNIKEDIERKKEYTDEEIEQKVQEGIAKEVTKIYEQLPPDKKSLANKAIAALESFQKKLRSRTYDAGLGIPVAVIDAGITTIKNAIKAGVVVANAVEMGIDKIKYLYGQSWDKEDDFRKDMMTGFKDAGFDTKKPKKEKPYINDKGELKIPEKFLRGLVKKGITEINDLSQQVLDEMKSEIPDLTIRQVRDAITDYGKRVNPTADDIKKQISTARRVGRLLSELEDLQNNKRKQTNPSTKAKLTEQEVKLKKQIAALNKKLPQTDDEVEAENEQRRESAKAATKRRIAELEEKLKNKDFSKPKPKKVIEDTELTRLNAEKERIQNQFDKEQYKNELKNRTGWQKAGDIALELISALPRALVASIDFSAVLVQGIIRVLTRPGQSIKAMGDMFKQFASEKVQQDWENKVKAQTWYPTLEASKIQLTEVGGKLSAREELFIGDWINHIWSGIGWTLALGNKKGQDFFNKLNPYKATNRAYVGYLNSIRVQAFLEGMKFIEKRGMTFESDPKVFQDWGQYVNNSTGRGTLGGLERSAKAMSIAFFAPRKISATIKLLSPYSIIHYAKMSPIVRQKAILNFASFLAMSTTLSVLGKSLVKKRCGDKDDVNFWDSNSSDFLTIRCGETRLDFFGGYKQQVVLMSRLATGRFTDAYGNETKLGDRYGKQINTRFDALEQYFANKLSPLASLGKRKLDERKGLELDPEEEALKGILPIWIQDVGALYKDHPTEIGIMLNILSIFGAGIQNYSSSSKKSSYTQEDLKDPVFKYFTDKKVPLPESRPSLIEIEDEEAGTLKKLDEYGEARVGEFNDVRKEKLKEVLEEIQNDGTVYVDQFGRVSTTDEDGDKDIIELDKLNEKQLKAILSIAGAKATKEAKKELFGSE